MLKNTLLTLTICAIASLAISEPVYAQINEFKITASDAAADDHGGESVSISGDYAVVGARLDDNDNGTDAGSVYIFKRTGTSWTQEAKLLASDGAAGDWFGLFVSISGDYVVVGARKDDDNGAESGSAYVFKRTGTSWVEEAKLLPSDGAAGDRFGVSVSVYGDYVVVGAWLDDDKGTDSGSAYVFKRSGTSWAEEEKLLASDGAEFDNFGSSISIYGDYVFVGAVGDNDNGRRSGSVYVFKRTSTGWAEEAKLLPSDGATEDWFGWSVSISGNYAVVGARLDGDNGNRSGSAYVFKRTSAGWAEEAKILASDGAADDQFGVSVSISGDYAVVGAFFHDDSGDRSGSAYFFKRTSTSWAEEAKILASDGAVLDLFGRSVSISGDYAIVGAPLDTDNGIRSGSAYLYKFTTSPGSIAGTVNDEVGPVSGAIIDLLDNSGLIDTRNTLEDGTYEFTEIDPGQYSVEMVTPLSHFSVSPAIVDVSVQSGQQTVVDFLLERKSIILAAQGGGYWKHQVNALIKNRSSDETEASLLGYLEDIKTYFDIFDGVEQSLQGLKEVLDPPKPAPMKARAERQFMALLLNLVSDKLATFTVVSSDDDAAEAIIHINSLLNDPGSTDTDYEKAKDIAEAINSGDLPLDPALIPEGLAKTVAWWLHAISIPKEFELKQNFPNPFNPETQIRYALHEDGDVTLIIYNILGEIVTNLVSEEQKAGNHTVSWNASNVVSGVYFYRLQAGDFVQTRKMLLLK